MKLFRSTFGYAAILLIAFSLNALALRESVFNLYVVIPFCAGIASLVIWSILTVLMKLKEGKSVGSVASIISAVIFLAICMTIYAFVSHFDKSWDLTQEGRRDLSDQTKKVLRGLNEEVAITCFFPVSGDSMTDVVRVKTMRFLERCKKFSNLISVEFIDPQKHPERVQAMKLPRLSAVGTVVITCGTRQRGIPLSDVTSRLEERDFTNVLINVLRDTQPTICFLTGHNERRITEAHPREGASLLKAMLERESYKTKEIAIRFADPLIPQDCDVLFINGPKSDLNAAEIGAIHEYLDAGGRMVVLFDPWIVENRGATEQFRPWLEWQYGIVVGDDIIVSKFKTERQAVTDLVPDFSLMSQYGFELDNTGDSRGSFSMSHPITRGFDQAMALYGARSVSLAKKTPEGVVGTEILRTMPDTWAETGIVDYYKDHVASPGAEEIQGSVGVGVAVTARTNVDAGGPDRDTRIVVVGDTVFASNENLVYAGHYNFMMNTIAWLCESEDLIAIRPMGKEEQPIILTQKQQQTIAWIAVLGAVQIVVICGIVAHLLRRKYQ